MPEPRLDRSAFSVTTTNDHEEETRTYWHSKTPYERLVALELTRQLVYGYDPATARLQRVLEITERQ